MGGHLILLEPSLSDVITLTDTSLAESLTDHEGLLVVDVYADWCAPCRAIAPTIATLAEHYHGRVVFGKLNFDENPSTPAQFGVRSIPTVLYFRNGEVVDRIVGAQPLAAFSRRLDALLGSIPVSA